MVKLYRAVFQPCNHIDLLWAGALALTAGDAVGGASPALYRFCILASAFLQLSPYKLLIPGGKNLRNRNLFRTARRTVMAGGTGNRFHAGHDFLRFADGGLFRAVQWLKIFHVGEIVPHLV